MSLVVAYIKTWKHENCPTTPASLHACQQQQPTGGACLDKGLVIVVVVVDKLPASQPWRVGAIINAAMHGEKTTGGRKFLFENQTHAGDWASFIGTGS